MPRGMWKVGAITILLLHLTACGSLLYPERSGQTGGRVDPTVAVLNGALLVAFVVPGLVAFGIDFYQGTIYLPDTAMQDENQQGFRTVQADGPLTTHQIEELVGQELGQNISLADAEWQTIEVQNSEELAANLYLTAP